MARIWIAIAGLAGFLGVGLGAAGRHLSLKGPPDELAIASQFLLIHALALIGVALLGERRPSRRLTLAGAAFTLGLVLFAGGLAANTLFGASGFLAVVPAGGTVLLLGWAALAVSAI